MPVPLYLQAGYSIFFAVLSLLLPCGIGFTFLVFPLRLDLLCDSQAFLPADVLRHPRCPVAHKSGVIYLSTQTDAVGDDMNMPVIGVLVGYGYPLVIVKPHSLGKQMRYPHQFRNRQFLLVLRSDTYFDTEELVPASAVVVADHLHFLMDSLRLPAAKIVEGKPTTELALPEDIVQCEYFRALSPLHFPIDDLGRFKTL